MITYHPLVAEGKAVRDLAKQNTRCRNETGTSPPAICQSQQTATGGVLTRTLAQTEMEARIGQYDTYE